MLPGEDQLSWMQRDLSSEEMKENEKQVFENAIKLLNNYWGQVVIDGFPVKPVHVKCNDNATPYDDEEVT